MGATVGLQAKGASVGALVGDLVGGLMLYVSSA